MKRSPLAPDKDPWTFIYVTAEMSSSTPQPPLHMAVAMDVNGIATTFLMCRFVEL